MSPVLFPVFDNEGRFNQMKAWCTPQLWRHCHAWSCPSGPHKRAWWAALQTGPLRTPACCCCWPTHSQGPLEIKVQPTTRREKRRDGKGRMHHRNPWGDRTLALLVSTENSQRDFLENVCETSTPSQAGISSGCQMEHLPTSDSMLDVVVGKWRAAFDTLKREHFSQRNNWSGHSPRFHSLHKTIGYTVFFCWPRHCSTSAKMGRGAEPNIYEAKPSVKKQLRIAKTAQNRKHKDRTPDHSWFVRIRTNKELRTFIH